MISTIKRKLESESLTGFVVNKSHKLTLIAIIDDFLFDGFAIVRNKDIKSEVVTETNGYYLKLMKMERAWHKTPEWVRKIDLDTWGSALKDIKSDVIILEDEIDEIFLIGPIAKVNKTSASVCHFNGLGEWEDVEQIKLSKITICKFMDRYSTTHAKYLKWKR